MVKQILQENKNEILKNNNIKDINDENITLLITQQEKIERWSQSQTMDKKILIQNNIKKIPVNKNDQINKIIKKEMISFLLKLYQKKRHHIYIQIIIGSKIK